MQPRGGWTVRLKDTNMITSKKVKKVIKRFKTIEDRANQEGAFDITAIAVWAYPDPNNEFDQGMCVAGWYLMSTGIPQSSPEVNFTHQHGSAVLAKELGFKNAMELKSWAAAHPELWGNKYGGEMFYSRCAWGNLYSSSKKPMTKVIKHLKKLAKRLKEVEKYEV